MYLRENVNTYEYKYERPSRSTCDEETPSTDSLKYDHGPPSAPSHFYETFIAEDADVADTSTCNGLWTGRYDTSDSAGDQDGALVMRFELGTDRQLTGYGKDALGKFTFAGSATAIEGEAPTKLRVDVKTTYVYLSTFWSEKPTFRYDGTVEVDAGGAFTRLSGKWGPWKENEKDFKAKGNFCLDRSSAVIARHRPSTEEYSKSAAKARWKLLSAVFLEQVRRQRWSWAYFRMRRDDRIAAVEAQKRVLVLGEPNWYLRKYPTTENAPDFKLIRRAIEMRLTVEDIAFYRWLGQQRLRAETAHMCVVLRAPRRR